MGREEVQASFACGYRKMNNNNNNKIMILKPKISIKIVGEFTFFFPKSRQNDFPVEGEPFASVV